MTLRSSQLKKKILKSSVRVAGARWQSKFERPLAVRIGRLTRPHGSTLTRASRTQTSYSSCGRVSEHPQASSKKEDMAYKTSPQVSNAELRSKAGVLWATNRIGESPTQPFSMVISNPNRIWGSIYDPELK